MNKEETLHAGICKWMALQWPTLIFNSDMSGVRLHRGLQSKVARLRSSRAMPDLMIFKPKYWLGNTWDDVVYPALFIELKAHGTRILLKDGTLTKDAHIQEQAAILKRLSDLGYLATFAVGADEAMALIMWYIADNSSKDYLEFHPDYLNLKDNG